MSDTFDVSISDPSVVSTSTASPSSNQCSGKSGWICLIVVVALIIIVLLLVGILILAQLSSQDDDDQSEDQE